MKVALSLVALIGLWSMVTTAANTNKIICYYGSWATYRSGDGKFSVEDIDPSLCSHIIYCFVGLNADGSVKILDPWNDITQNALGRTVALKKRNKNLKVMVAIGGWNEGSTIYSAVVNSPSLRSRFVSNLLSLLRQHQLDGLDLDWEYPAQRGGAASDRQAFSQLIQELKSKFTPYGYILSAAVGATANHRSLSYEVSKLSQYLDFINIMTYDLHGSWDGVTGQNSPLYDSGSALNVASITSDWVRAGTKPEKLIVGVGLYGRSFTLANPGNNRLRAPTTGPGNPGPFTQEGGMLSYMEICRARWTEVWDDDQKVPYAYNGNQWVGYDNKKSVILKAQFAVSNNFGGVMVWSIESDDKMGTCGNGKFPLLRALGSVINIKGNSEAPKPTKSPTEGPTINPPAGNPCYKEGFVVDPDNCNIYYTCEKLGNNYVPMETHFCPKYRYFDSLINGCNFKCR